MASCHLPFHGRSNPVPIRLWVAFSLFQSSIDMQRMQHLAAAWRDIDLDHVKWLVYYCSLGWCFKSPKKKEWDLGFEPFGWSEFFTGPAAWPWWAQQFWGLRRCRWRSFPCWQVAKRWMSHSKFVKCLRISRLESQDTFLFLSFELSVSHQVSHAINLPSWGKKGGGHKNMRVSKTLQRYVSQRKLARKQNTGIPTRKLALWLRKWCASGGVTTLRNERPFWHRSSNIHRSY